MMPKETQPVAHHGRRGKIPTTQRLNRVITGGPKFASNGDRRM